MGGRKGRLKARHPAAAPQLGLQQGCPETELVQEVPLKIGDFITQGLFLW